jgi:hypothetical protein
VDRQRLANAFSRSPFEFGRFLAREELFSGKL